MKVNNYQIKEIKTASQSTAKAVNDLIQELFSSFDHQITQSYITKVLQQKNTKVIGAYVNRKLIGLVLGHFYQSLSRQVLILDELIISNNFRDKGIATQLLVFLKGWAKQLGADCIECTTRVKNQKAKRFFLKKGFYDRRQLSLRLPLKNL